MFCIPVMGFANEQANQVDSQASTTEVTTMETMVVTAAVMSRLSLKRRHRSGRDYREQLENRSYKDLTDVRVMYLV
ncbi:hypothetical protein OH492_14800 [Vibrio chagasii]|nr:hypothetical protein [Vibrio chagasii]